MGKGRIQPPAGFPRGNTEQPSRMFQCLDAVKGAWIKGLAQGATFTHVLEGSRVMVTQTPMKGLVTPAGTKAVTTSIKGKPIIWRIAAGAGLATFIASHA